MNWLRRIFGKRTERALQPKDCMVRVDSGVVRIAVRGTEWCSAFTRLSPDLDCIVLSKCENGKWYSLADLGITLTA